MKFYSAILASAVMFAPFGEARADESEGWTIGLNGGVTHYSRGDDQRFASLSIAREFEQGYVQLGVFAVRGGLTQGVLAAVPVDSEAVTVSGGRSFGDASIDGYVSLGQRRFDPETLPGRRVTIDSKGSSFAIGGGLSYDVALSSDIVLSPRVAVDYDKVDIGRALILPGGNIATVTSREDGVTGSAGATLQHLFGKGGRHAIGVNAGFVATSNSSAARSGNTGGMVGRIISARNVPGQSDQWSEVGASASIAVSDALRLDIDASRTIGFAGPEATTLTAGLRFRF